ncbi:MAG: PD-(D/E)XK motif protein [Sphingosinicella sp.]|uniref:PD-(D/E)XK motif protein n=1 Tax=Sphingosinicella sp. TaxID=1917971 RepID=UPI004037E5A7
MTDSPGLLPDWEAFERDYVSSGIPHIIVVRTEPQAALYLDPSAGRLGVRFRRTSEPRWAGADPLIEVRIAEVAIDGARHLEVWTDARGLYRNFYGLAVEVLSAVAEDGEDPVSALSSAVARWDALLARPSLLTDEAQAGLFGELWLLDRLTESKGSDGLYAWVGPGGHAHDFRLGTAEIEVKTTSGQARVHMINGASQLQPSPDSTLFLLSLKLTDAGSGGLSLPEAVSALSARFASDPGAPAIFRGHLDKLGYRDADAAHYPRRRKLRDEAVLIEITDGVPRLTPEALGEVDTRFAPERVGLLSYQIDVTGLGVPDGTPEFEAVIPQPSSKVADDV